MDCIQGGAYLSYHAAVAKNSLAQSDNALYWMKDYHFALRPVMFDIGGGNKATGSRVIRVGMSAMDVDEGSDLDAEGSEVDMGSSDGGEDVEVCLCVCLSVCLSVCQLC